MNPLQGLAEIAEKYTGIRENPRNSNLGAGIFRFKAATTLDPDRPFPWCAAFVSYCVQEFDRMSPAIALAIPPRIAAVAEFPAWATKVGALMFHPRDGIHTPQPGDIVIFTFSHIGIVVWNFETEGLLRVVEGNTNAGGEREGDGVYDKERSLSVCKLFIRLPAKAKKA